VLIWILPKKWNEEGFVGFGRLTVESIRNLIDQRQTHWCKLSDDAWIIAWNERKARNLRMTSKRTWQTTAEKRVGD